MKVILKEKELWLLILLGMVYFYRPLFMGETFAYPCDSRQLQCYMLLFPEGELDMSMKELPV
ncbi:MAG: hypothetical protein GY797_16255 [Deltaproteobacteria bacterium]|nr:hypothetical protein [Deltaproteobacteria bacterium]